MIRDSKNLESGTQNMALQLKPGVIPGEDPDSIFFSNFFKSVLSNRDEGDERDKNGFNVQRVSRPMSNV